MQFRKIKLEKIVFRFYRLLQQCFTKDCLTKAVAAGKSNFKLNSKFNRISK
jgi:hypothetical protein